MIHVTCSLCGADDWQCHLPESTNGHISVDAVRCTNPGYGSHAQIVQCNRCGFLYANPRWDESELLGAYEAVEDETYLEEREGRELTFSKHLQAMEKVVGTSDPASPRQLLDVGAYIGVFVEVAQAAGWDVLGVEPSTWAASVAQAQGLPVLCGTQDAPELAGRQFDVVTMWDVIEHVDDPSGEMAKAYQLLKPGGWLVVHTMDVDSHLAKLMGKRWPWYMDMHIHYFSQQTMARMLQMNGFHVVWSGAQGRFLRLGYVATRVGGLNPILGRMAQTAVNAFGLSEKPVPINFGDLFTVYAQKPA